MARTDQLPELSKAVDCNTLAVKCPTCSGGIYCDQLQDHDQWCPLEGALTVAADDLLLGNHHRDDDGCGQSFRTATNRG